MAAHKQITRGNYHVEVNGNAKSWLVTIADEAQGFIFGKPYQKPE